MKVSRQAKWILTAAVGLLLLALLGACQREDNEEVVAPQTAVRLPPTAAVVVLNPTHTPIPTNTLPPTLTKTATPIHTPSPTTTPQPPPTLSLTPPSGVIYFLWDPKIVTDLRAQVIPIPNLYKAKFQNSASEWTIQPVVEDKLIGAKTLMSSDQTKIAFSLIENDMGTVNGLYLYDLTQDVLTNVPTQNGIFLKRWLPDGQTLAFDMGNLYFWNTASQVAPGELIYEKENGRNWIDVSPNGEWVAVKVKDQIKLINTKTKELKHTITDAGSIFNHETELWSPDSHWLMLTDNFKNLGLLIDLTINEAYGIANPPDVNSAVWAWSHDSQSVLLFDGSRDAPSRRIYQLNPYTQQIEILWEAPPIIVPDVEWTPDDSGVLFLLFDDGLVTLVQFDIHTKELTELWQHNIELDYYPRYPNQNLVQAWSPDGEWGIILLMTAKNKHILVLLHIESGQIYPLTEEQMTLLPYSFYWVPEE